MSKSIFSRYSRSTLLSVGFHIALIIALTVGFRFVREPASAPPAQSVAIEATVVDEAVIEREMARIEAQEQAEIMRRQQEEREAREQAEAARRELEQQQRELEAARQEQQRREQEARAEEQRLAELQRQRAEEEAARQEAEQRRLEEERQQREAEARRQREEEERRQREEQQRLAREAEEARQRAEMEAQLQRELAAETERRRAEEAGLLDQYRRLIQARIEQNWIRPASAGPGLECEVNVTQIPSGDVIDVRVGRCNGDEAVVRSIEQAVLRASPLPQPPVPSLFSRNLELIFEPDA